MAVYFVSDLHLEGAGELLERTCRFLDGLPNGSTIYFLGDSFDFSIGWPFVTDGALEAFWSAVRRATARAVCCRFLVGNHDPDLGPQPLQSGAELWAAGVVELDGLRCWIGHGDVEASDSLFKRAICGLTHCRAILKAARAVPPAVMLWLLKRYKNRRRLKSAQLNCPRRVLKLFLSGRWADADVVLLGHFHHPFCGVRKEGERERRLFILGDQRCYSHYVCYRDQRFEYWEELQPGCWTQRQPCEMTCECVASRLA